MKAAFPEVGDSPLRMKSSFFRDTSCLRAREECSRSTRRLRFQGEECCSRGTSCLWFQEGGCCSRCTRRLRFCTRYEVLTVPGRRMLFQMLRFQERRLSFMKEECCSTSYELFVVPGKRMLFQMCEVPGRKNADVFFRERLRFQR